MPASDGDAALLLARGDMAVCVAGYQPALKASDRMHGVAQFDITTGSQKKGPAGPPTYTKVCLQPRPMGALC